MLRFTAYLLFRYYSKGKNKEVAYFSTFCILSLMFFFHFLQAAMIFNFFSYLPSTKGDERIVRYLKTALMLVPIFAALFFLVKKSSLATAEYSESKVRRGYWFLILYAILSFALLVYLAAEVLPKSE
jgi:ABC-type transport system involved in cytochrome c biogenesis permease subunit